MRYFLAALLVLLCGTAIAQDQQLLSADGALFSYQENRHGAVLTALDQSSQAPLLSVPNASVMTVGEVIYLGRSCDAFSRIYGDERWRSAGGSFLVEFQQLRVVFPGQELGIAPNSRCGSS